MEKREGTIEALVQDDLNDVEEERADTWKTNLNTEIHVEHDNKTKQLLSP